MIDQGELAERLIDRLRGKIEIVDVMEDEHHMFSWRPDGFYDWRRDYIAIDFEGIGGPRLLYTLLHELGHWTGPRDGRTYPQTGSEGKEEEAIAHLVAFNLLREFGIEPVDLFPHLGLPSEPFPGIKNRVRAATAIALGAITVGRSIGGMICHSTLYGNSRHMTHIQD